MTSVGEKVGPGGSSGEKVLGGILAVGRKGGVEVHLPQGKTGDLKRRSLAKQVDPRCKETGEGKGDTKRKKRPFEGNYRPGGQSKQGLGGGGEHKKRNRGGAASWSEESLPKVASDEDFCVKEGEGGGKRVHRRNSHGRGDSPPPQANFGGGERTVTGGKEGAKDKTHLKNRESDGKRKNC